jgi:hypothetical protein
MTISTKTRWTARVMERKMISFKVMAPTQKWLTSTMEPILSQRNTKNLNLTSILTIFLKVKKMLYCSSAKENKPLRRKMPQTEHLESRWVKVERKLPPVDPSKKGKMPARENCGTMM